MFRNHAVWKWWCCTGSVLGSRC